MIPPEILRLYTISQLLDMVLKMEQSSGLLETHGDLTGVNKVSSELLEEPITLLLKQTVLGLHQKIPGQMMKDIIPLKKRRTIH